ncbi:MAG: SpoIID/LytB domain-containing protein [Blastocatellia bacterium]
MQIVNRPARLWRSRAVASLILSACLLLQSGSYFAAFAQKAKDAPPPFDRNYKAQETINEQDYSRPRRIDRNEDGPIVRIALVTDVSSITLSSSSGFALLRYDQNNRDAEKIVARPLRVELKQQSIRLDTTAPAREQIKRNEYRVEVGSVSNMIEARKVIDDLGKRFDEPISNLYDKQSDAFHILIGRFASKSEAMAMIEQLRHAGYTASHIAPDYVIGDQPQTKPAKTAKSVKPKSHPQQASVAPQYRRVTQLVAMEGDRVIALTEQKLVLRAVSARAEGEAEYPAQNAPAQSYIDKRKQDEKAVWGSAKDTAPHASPRIEASGSAPFIRVGDKYYRGEIHLTLNARGQINVINALPLEQYLRGVVAMELSPGLYPAIEALKAQAVAARTYALTRLNQSRDADFDLRDDTRSQVYGGISAEQEMSNRAIEETRGVVAFYTGEDGTDSPIEALYTANCGGQTENNEVIFGGKPLSYLRSVACAPDRHSIADRDIASNRAADSMVEPEGRSILREIALLQVMGFTLPRRATGSYLKSAPDQGELQGWIGHIVELSQKEGLRAARNDSTLFFGFAQLIASAIYGEGRAALLLTPADVDYLLAGLESRDTPQDVRASIAALLKDGILRLPASFDNRSQITRAFAIETIARALSFRSRLAKPDTLKTQIARLRFDAARPVENGRLIIASSIAKPQPVAPKASRIGEMKSKEVIAKTSAVKEIASQKEIPSQINPVPDGFEIDASAWLFRSFGNESYAVTRLTLIGGERITFHLNPAGRVDFLEAAVAEHSASSDRYSSVAQWQERVTAEEVERRLARARINVGRVESLTPVAFSESNRVTEMEITGYGGIARLRGPQIRSALGLKENLFVVDREMDASGHITAFVFTGRGWGHGVGMCQTGAYGLAKEGYSYTAILQKYYTGVKVRKAY